MNNRSSQRPLLDEYPLLVLPTLAVKLGLNAAIVIQQIHYWIKMNERMDKKKAATHFYEGRWWTYNSYENWRSENFPFWSHATIRRIFGGLKERGLILCREADKRNDGLWVTIAYEEIDRLLGSAHFEQTYQGGSAQNEQKVKATETNTETTIIRRVANGSYDPLDDYGDEIIVGSDKDSDKWEGVDISHHSFVAAFLEVTKTPILKSKKLVDLFTKDIKRPGANGRKSETYSPLLTLWDTEPGFEAFARSRMKELVAGTPAKPEDILKNLQKLEVAPEEGSRQKPGFFEWKRRNPSLCKSPDQADVPAVIVGEAPPEETDTYAFGSA